MDAVLFPCLKFALLLYVPIVKPVCANFAPVTRGLPRMRTSRVVCPVLAHPPPTRFQWSFNNSVETVQVGDVMWWTDRTNESFSTTV